MRELRLVAMSDDGTRLILRATDDDTPMSLPLDERLYAALRGDRARLGQLEVQMDSQLRPRDIQAKVRGGESVESLAATAGVPLERVMRFAGPVLAERQHIADRAQQAVIRRTGGDPPNRPLSERVAEWVSSFDVDPETIEWDAWRRDDGRWVVSAAWQVSEEPREALFTFDPTGRSVAPDNDEARAVAGERPAAPAEPTAAEPPAPAGPARLAVVGPPEDEEPDAAPPQPAAADDTAEPADDPDSQPTVPVSLSAQRTSRPSDRRRLREPDQVTHASQGKPDPWAPEEATNPEPARLTDVTSRAEEEGGEAPGKDTADEPVAANARAAGGETPARPQSKRYSKSKRPSVPSWDEIMFGRRERSD